METKKKQKNRVAPEWGAYFGVIIFFSMRAMSQVYCSVDSALMLTLGVNGPLQIILCEVHFVAHVRLLTGKRDVCNRVIAPSARFSNLISVN